jgi:IMP cyclohydrolase
VPSSGFEAEAAGNPYVAYTCLRVTDTWAVVGNGSHVDRVSEALLRGVSTRYAITSVLEEMGYERDEYRTPRIIGVVGRDQHPIWLGVVREDALMVRDFEIENGRAFYIATYERNHPSSEFADDQFDVNSAEEACDYVLERGNFTDLSGAVLSASAFETATGFAIANRDLNHNAKSSG